jgi:hypothetical protein
MRIGLHRGRREVPLTVDLRYDALVHCGSARAHWRWPVEAVSGAIGPLLRQHAVVQSGLPSHWDDHCCWLLLAPVWWFTGKCLIRPGVHESSAELVVENG